MERRLSQNDKIMRHLHDHGSITPLDAMAEYGIMRLASRISDLRRQGVKIRRDMAAAKNRYGEKTRFARYELIKEDTNKNDANAS